MRQRIHCFNEKIHPAKSCLLNLGITVFTALKLMNQNNLLFMSLSTLHPIQRGIDLFYEIMTVIKGLRHDYDLTINNSAGQCF